MEQGHPVNEAAARAVGTAGGAVVFAGGTVVIALCSLAVAQIPIVSALGYSAAIVVLIAVITAVTLLPALLSILGKRIDALRVPFLRPPAHDHRPHGWARWARGVGKRPLPAMLLGVGDPARAGDPGAEPPARPAGQRADAQVHPDPAVLRPAAGGLRPRHQRPVPDRRGLRRQPRPQRSEEAQPGHPAAEPAGAAGGRAGDRAARGPGRAARRGAGPGPAGGLLRAADQAGEAGLPAGGVPEDAGERPAARQASRTRSARRRASRTCRRRRSTSRATRRSSP